MHVDVIQIKKEKIVARAYSIFCTTAGNSKMVLGKVSFLQSFSLFFIVSHLEPSTTEHTLFYFMQTIR